LTVAIAVKIVRVAIRLEVFLGTRLVVVEMTAGDVLGTRLDMVDEIAVVGGGTRYAIAIAIEERRLAMRVEVPLGRCLVIVERATGDIVLGTRLHVIGVVAILRGSAGHAIAVAIEDVGLAMRIEIGLGGDLVVVVGAAGDEIGLGRGGLDAEGAE
jgi:hypothetical protein